MSETPDRTHLVIAPDARTGRPAKAGEGRRRDRRGEPGRHTGRVRPVGGTHPEGRRLPRGAAPPGRLAVRGRPANRPARCGRNRRPAGRRSAASTGPGVDEAPDQADRGAEHPRPGRAARRRGVRSLEGHWLPRPPSGPDRTRPAPRHPRARPGSRADRSPGPGRRGPPAASGFAHRWDRSGSRFRHRAEFHVQPGRDPGQRISRRYGTSDHARETAAARRPARDEQRPETACEGPSQAGHPGKRNKGSGHEGTSGFGGE